jgi:uroporphyrinogen III methyltransferase / synthase
LPHLRIAARGSKLSVAQTEATLAQLKTCFKELSFDLVKMETAGDKDLTTSLTSGLVAGDFFTDDLDRAVLDGHVDAAVHSAKDLPQYEGTGIEWFYLPWREDPRDAILWPRGRARNTTNPVIGISSPSREEYARRRWPEGSIKPIRGGIDSRIAQMDRGDFDVIILAVAGLKRLGIADRLDEIISMQDLPTHEDQGFIALTFKQGHPQMTQLRHLLLPPILICGAGTGREGNYSVAVQKALEGADVCLHDVLLAPEILEHCKGQLVNVGKRFSDHAPGESQRQIVEKMLHYSRRGSRVVRLKGGDPSLFGRLSEEVDALIAHQIPFKVCPGIPWLCSAPLRHGIYLTERQNIRHFQVATGTEIEGKAFDGRDLDPEKGPIYFFMAVRKLDSIVEGLIQRGYAAHTPCAVLREDAGPENIVRAPLHSIAEKLASSSLKPPALFIVGDATDPQKAFTPPAGPLAGCRVLIPGTDGTRDALAQTITELGGVPVPLRVFDLKPVRENRAWVHQLATYHWLLLSSGSAVEVLLQILKEEKIDLRSLPKIAVSGPSASKALQKVGLFPDYQPDTYTSRALGEGMLKKLPIKDQRVLIPRSSASQSALPNILEEAGAMVQVEVLYENEAIAIDQLPAFDAVCFCSPSAVQSLLAHREVLEKATVASIGPVTSEALRKLNWRVDVEPQVYDAQHLVWALASHQLWGKTKS